MADYVAPTAAEIKARFPEFASVDSGRIDAIVGEAGAFVDGSWREADRKIAHQFLTAHMLIMEGVLNTGNPLQTIATGAIKSESIGDASVTYADPGGSAGNNSEYATTTYGRRFLALRRGNFAGPRVLNQ